VEFTKTAFRWACANKAYSVQILALLASSTVNLFTADPNLQNWTSNVNAVLVGSLMATGVAEQRIKGLRLSQDALEGRERAFNERMETRNRALEEDSAKILAAQNKLQAEETRVKTLEQTYRTRCETRADQRLATELARTKNNLEKERDKTTAAIKAESDKAVKAAFEQAENARLQASLQGAEIQNRMDVLQAECDAKVAESQANSQAVIAEYQDNLEALKQAEEVIRAKAASGVGAAMMQVKQEKQKAISVIQGTNVAFSKERDTIDLKFRQLSDKLLMAQLELDRAKADLEGYRQNRLAQGGTDEAKLSRRIHRWLENELKIHLHSLRIDFIGSNTHRFCYVNRGAGVKKFEKLADDLSAYISLPVVKVVANDDEGTVEISVKTTKREIVKQSDIRTICKASDHYLKQAKGWARAQFLGPSEAGKTSSAEILGYQWSKAKAGVRWFHYPNADSVKNYVTAPVASVGSTECVSAFVDLVRRVDKIQSGTEAKPTQPEHHVFDDSDSVIQMAINDGLTRKEILDFFTRASHCGIGFCLIGHSTAANRLPGFTHSDFNNLTRIYAGTDIMTALQNTQILTEDKAKGLMTQFEKIRDYFEAKNDEFGLVATGDAADPQAYRFVLVIEGNRRPYFCELPRLDMLSDLSDIEDKIEENAASLPDAGDMPATQLKAPNGKGSHQKANPATLAKKPSKQGGMALMASDNLSKALRCPGCGSTNVKSDGKTKAGKRKGRCKEPGCNVKCFTEGVAKR
jgi:hypothetical protein